MRKSILAVCTAIALFACSGDRVGPNTGVAGFEDETKTAAVQKEKIYGVAQKGPFVNGNVVIYELDDKYEKTKRTFKGKTNSKGYFEIEIKDGKLASPYVIIEAKGKYANEVSGKTSSDAITLKAVADISNKDNVNINVLTDLESDKVIKLAKEGKSFEDAKTQAQKEVFTSLGISEGSVTRNSEDMALFGGNSSDSVLLVVSVSLQGDKTEAELSALLADLSGSGKFDVEKGLKDVDMGKVKDHILEIEPSAVVSIPTTPKAPTTNTTPNTSTSRPTTPSTSTPSYTPPTSYTPPAQSNPVAQPTPTPVPPPVVIEKEKPICSEVITKDCVSKCGNWEYDPATQVCKNGEVKDPICGEVKYNPATHFCTRSENNPKVVEKCGGKGYDTGTKICVEGKIEETNLFRDARDGKKYKYVQIGDQVWMAENLNFNAEDSRCYGDNEANCTTYGRLYNWKTAMADFASSYKNPSNVQGVCPDGWHLPSDDEWTQLTDFVGSDNANTKLKATSWNGTDDYGFSALPGGLRANNMYSGISGSSTVGGFWSATQYDDDNAYYYRLSNSLYNETRVNDYKTNSMSVRCVKGQGVASGICNGNKLYNPTTHFCYGGKEIYALYNGEKYEPALCGDVKYNPATHFCSSNITIYPLCGDKKYEPTEYCKLGTVQSIPKFTDERDKKEYKYVEIGDQVWMAENLNYNADSSKCSDDKKFNFDPRRSDLVYYNTSTCDTYGRLYNWETAVDACPSGWHLPSKDEWAQLKNFVGGDGGIKLKATSGWDYYKDIPNGTDDYGFAALPGSNGITKTFNLENVGKQTNWWTSTKYSSGTNSYAYGIIYYNMNLNEGGQNRSSYFFSVRCVKGVPTYTTCDNKYYDPSTHFCSGTTIVSLCNKQEYNPSTEFCASSKIYSKCGGESYTPTTQFCYEGTTIASLCKKLEYNPSTEFCYSNMIYSKCNGEEYNPARESCSEE